jgi:spoIIIJ-associated protein
LAQLAAEKSVASEDKMNATRATIEIIAPTVEEAVEKGLADLGLPQDAVDIEILDAGSRGLFGLGSRQARIRLIVKGAQAAESTPVATLAAESEFEPISTEEETAPPSQPAVAPLEEDDVLRVARETVSDLLERMKVRAQVVASYGEPDDPKGRIPVQVDVRGDDLNILIGRRSETLNSLQYITNLIVCKELERSISVVIDVEGYRLRRASQLRQLARRMADQAIKTGRRQALEPMPANERRIIHIELREHEGVTTESIGEDPHRKVTIIPKE